MDMLQTKQQNVHTKPININYTIHICNSKKKPNAVLKGNSRLK